jgi:hypothetical protein
MPNNALPPRPDVLRLQEAGAARLAAGARRDGIPAPIPGGPAKIAALVHICHYPGPPSCDG